MTDALSPAVFFDRDGTIMEDCDYCSDPKDVKIFPGVQEALLKFEVKGIQTHRYYESERDRPRADDSRAISRRRSGSCAASGR